MRKFKLTAILTALIILSAHFPTAFSDNLNDIVVAMQIDNPIMLVNGIDTEIDYGRGTAPTVVNGRTLVPIRAIIESFGGNVNWDERTQSINLGLCDDEIVLTVDSVFANINNKRITLDVAPSVINGRTMLPIRPIAEGFNLGVAWNESSKTVYIIRNIFDEEDYEIITANIPKYSGQPYTIINDNKPFFRDYEIIDASFEYYSTPDDLGRCNVCFASVASDLMPTEARESISSVTPTGWKSVTYDSIDGGYLYNRCHLIAFLLTGENSNEKNLITGTRYLNISGMLPFETQTANYIKNTGNRVLYRSTPVFSNNNLVADGVILEAYSVEDSGRGISFCVYCYNVQPGIYIDYATGSNQQYENEYSSDNTENIIAGSGNEVFRTPSGKKYHFDAQCGGKNSFGISLDDALNAGLTPCLKCSK